MDVLDIDINIELVSVIYEWVWSENFWLPENMTWKQVEADANYPIFIHVLYCIPIIGLLLLLRLAFREFVTKPIAKRYGIKIRHYYEENQLLNEVYLNKKPSKIPAMIQNLAVQLNWDERRVKRWFRNRERARHGGIFRELFESGWKLVFFLLLVVFILFAIANDKCIWDLDSCMDDYANFKTSKALWWFTMFEISFNSSLVVAQVFNIFNIKPLDFIKILFHHALIIGIVFFLFLNNAMRVGSILMLCLDITEIPYELAKVFRCLKKTIFSQNSFMIFLVLWFTIRVGFVLCILLPKLSNKCFQLKPNGHLICYIGILQGCALIALHIYWTVLILLDVKKFIIRWDSKDIRSDNEDSDEDKTNEKSD